MGIHVFPHNIPGAELIVSWTRTPADGSLMDCILPSSSFVVHLHKPQYYYISLTLQSPSMPLWFVELFIDEIGCTALSQI